MVKQMNTRIEIITNSRELTAEDRDNLKECYRVLPDSPALSVLEHQLDKDICFGIRVIKEVDGKYIPVYTSIVQRQINKDTEQVAHKQLVSGSKHKHLMTPEDWDKVQQCYLFAATHEGVDMILTVGRIGWSLLAEKYGYKLTNTFKSISGKRCATWELKL